MKAWDIVIAFLLLYTCTVTPFEVGLTPDITYTNPIFVIDRFVRAHFQAPPRLPLVFFTLLHAAHPSHDNPR